MHYKLKNNILWKSVDGELVIVKTDTDEYLYLNPTGADIFEMIATGLKKDDIFKELTLRYDASEEMIGSDVDEIMKELKDSGIIEEVV